MGNCMAFSPGPLEIIILLGIFFILFGAERLPKMANALGRSKGEFQKGLSEFEFARILRSVRLRVFVFQKGPL